MASFLVRALKFVFSTVPHTVPYLKLSIIGYTTTKNVHLYTLMFKSNAWVELEYFNSGTVSGDWLAFNFPRMATINSFC